MDSTMENRSGENKRKRRPFPACLKSGLKYASLAASWGYRERPAPETGVGADDSVGIATPLESVTALYLQNWC